MFDVNINNEYVHTTDKYLLRLYDAMDCLKNPALEKDRKKLDKLTEHFRKYLTRKLNAKIDDNFYISLGSIDKNRNVTAYIYSLYYIETKTKSLRGVKSGPNGSIFYFCGEKNANNSSKVWLRSDLFILISGSRDIPTALMARSDFMQEPISTLENKICYSYEKVGLGIVLKEREVAIPLPKPGESIQAPEILDEISPLSSVIFNLDSAEKQ